MIYLNEILRILGAAIQILADALMLIMQLGCIWLVLLVICSFSTDLIRKLFGKEEHDRT